MSHISCAVEISNFCTSWILVDPKMYQQDGQCPVPLDPLIMPGANGSGTFTSNEGTDLFLIFQYNLRQSNSMLVVVFLVPADPTDGIVNNFIVQISNNPEPDKVFYKSLISGSKGGGGHLKVSRDALVEVRATMSDTPNAVLKVEINDVLLEKMGAKGPLQK